MEARTGEHKPSSGTSSRRLKAEEKKSSRPKERGLMRRASARALSSAKGVWETYLREPLAKGLITTGAVLTESGRLILNYDKPSKQNTKVLH